MLVTDEARFSKLVKELPSPSIARRFQKWTEITRLTGWESDIKAFNEFTVMRSRLFHRGKRDFKLQIVVPGDVRKLDDISERYISLALFGDSEVYSSKRPQQMQE